MKSRFPEVHLVWGRARCSPWTALIHVCTTYLIIFIVHCLKGWPYELGRLLWEHVSINHCPRQESAHSCSQRKLLLNRWCFISEPGGIKAIGLRCLFIKTFSAKITIFLRCSIKHLYTLPQNTQSRRNKCHHIYCWPRIREAACSHAC